MQKCLPPEHDNELIADTFEHLLDAGRVPNKGGAHLESSRRDGAQSGLNVIRNPLNEVARALGLDVAHLILDLLHGNFSAAVFINITHQSEGGEEVLLTRKWHKLRNGRYGNREPPSCF